MNDFFLLLITGALIFAMAVLGVTATGRAMEAAAQNNAVAVQAQAVRDVGIAQANAHEKISLAQVELTRDLARLSVRGGGDPILTIALIVVVVLALAVVVFLLAFAAVMLSGAAASRPAPRRALPPVPAVRYLDQDVYIEGQWAPVSRGALVRAENNKVVSPWVN